MFERISIPTPYGYSIPALLGVPEGRPRGTVIMTHGIFSDKNENGRYPRQAEIHHEHGWRTLRFDWQGHGDHPVPFDSTTVLGSVDDLQSVYAFCSERWEEDPVNVVASSYGGSLFLLHQSLPPVPALRKVLLLNPVTDYRHTFYEHVSGELASEFSAQVWKSVLSTGHAETAPGKVMSRKFASELLVLKPYLGFDELTVPVMVLHGTADESVSFDVTKSHSSRSPQVTFQPILDADHAFAAPWAERLTFDLIKEWFYVKE